MATEWSTNTCLIADYFIIPVYSIIILFFLFVQALLSFIYYCYIVL